MTTKVSATDVKELRDKTGVGMSDCKKALEEAGGDMEAAIRVLRERGIAKAAKRSDRTASEGLVSVALARDYARATLAQLSCETDFVARNEEFSALIASISKAGLAKNIDTLENLQKVVLEDGRTVSAAVSDILTKIGEKIELSAYSLVAGDVVSGYIHPPGKIGVLISASAPDIAEGKKAAVSDALREVAMHIAAFSPRFLDASQVDGSTLESEREIFAAMARNEGKPEAIIPKIVDGKIKSFYKDNCLVDQAFAKDPSKSVAQVVKEIGASAGVELKLTGFVRVQIGSN
jgi:elongation factor Ts